LIISYIVVFCRLLLLPIFGASYVTSNLHFDRLSTNGLFHSRAPSPFVLSLSKDETSNLPNPPENSTNGLAPFKYLPACTANYVKEPDPEIAATPCNPRTNPTLQVLIRHGDWPKFDQPLHSSLRAKRSNPGLFCPTLDCFVASLLAMTNFELQILISSGSRVTRLSEKNIRK
jgi:hypothetical protein